MSDNKATLMRDEQRGDLIRDLAFLAQLQQLLQSKLRVAKDTFREDKYMTYDLEDRVAEAGRLYKELQEMVEGLQGDRYHY